MYEYVSEICMSEELSVVLNLNGRAGWKYVSCQLIGENTFLVIMDRYIHPENDGREVIHDNSIAMRG